MMKPTNVTSARNRRKRTLSTQKLSIPMSARDEEEHMSPKNFYSVLALEE